MRKYTKKMPYRGDKESGRPDIRVSERPKESMNTALFQSTRPAVLRLQDMTCPKQGHNIVLISPHTISIPIPCDFSARRA